MWEVRRLTANLANSVTCDTPADAAARISATGATGGLVGKREEPRLWARYVIVLALLFPNGER